MKTSNDCLSDVENKLSELKTGGWAIESWYAEWEQTCKGADNRGKRAQTADELRRMTEKLEGFASKLADIAWEYKQAISDYDAVVEHETDPCPTGIPAGRPL